MEIADYDILQRVFETFVVPQTSKKPGESDDSYRDRLRDNVELWELKRQYLAVLRKLRRVIVGE